MNFTLASKNREPTIAHMAATQNFLATWPVSLEPALASKPHPRLHKLKTHNAKNKAPRRRRVCDMAIVFRVD